VTRILKAYCTCQNEGFMKLLGDVE